MLIAVANRRSFVVADDIYRILNPDGEIVGAIPELSGQRLIDFYRWMVLGRIFSDTMVALQRQGRMGTFSPLSGQEATAVGLAAPLKPNDWLVASYRETLAYLVKGVPMLALMKQWGGEIADNYPRKACCLPLQLVLGTQMLHGVGVAQAIQYKQRSEVVVVACGDGATSQGDFNEALNFAGVFKVPAVFVVQNNGWAISTPRSRQTAAEYIADRGPGFGIPGQVVDGNDILAVYQCVCEAIKRARAGGGSTLIEAITYRLGAHTTADDPTRYRPEAELEEWTRRDPLLRFRKFLITQNMMTESDNQYLREMAAAEIQATVEAYEALPPQTPHQLFSLTYAEPTFQLKRQLDQFIQEVNRES